MSLRRYPSQHILKFLSSKQAYRLSTVADKYAVKFKEARRKEICMRRGFKYLPSLLPNGLRLALARERMPLSYTPKIKAIDFLPKPIVVQKDRRSSWKWNKIICKYSASAKSKKLKREQRERRLLILNERRGISRIEFNLGILLNITDDYIPELSMNDNQIIPSFRSTVVNYTNYVDFSTNQSSNLDLIENNQTGTNKNLHHSSINNKHTQLQKYHFMTINGEPSLHLKQIYNQAENLVRSTFAKYDVLMDLNHTIEDGFTCDILLAKSKVVAVQEFVLMKNYVWLESLIVSESYRRQGIGKVFIKRLIDVAKAVKKSILLYSLMESLPFYFSCGFQLCPQFPFQEG